MSAESIDIDVQSEILLKNILRTCEQNTIFGYILSIFCLYNVFEIRTQIDINLISKLFSDGIRVKFIFSLYIRSMSSQRDIFKRHNLLSLIFFCLLR